MRSIQPSEIILSKAVNKTAKLVTNQSGCSDRFLNDNHDLQELLQQASKRITEIRTELNLSPNKKEHAKLKRLIVSQPELKSHPLVYEWAQLNSLMGRLSRLIEERTSKAIHTDFTGIKFGDEVYVISNGKALRTSVIYVNEKKDWFRVKLFNQKFTMSTGRGGSKLFCSKTKVMS